jgi:hypothetical protein
MDSSDQVDLDAPTQLALLGDGRAVLSPKRPRIETAGLADIFPYYAGFSYDWARSKLAALCLPESSIVLDPWNGSGTTTLAAQSIGLRSIGIDLNPVANVIAQLRAQTYSAQEGITAAPDASAPLVSLDDPLLAWFTRPTASRIRHWILKFESGGRASSALGLVAMFRVVRRLTKSFEGSNPTWVRRASEARAVVDIADVDLDRMLTREQRAIRDRLRKRNALDAKSVLITGSALGIPVADASVNAILTSPPYLTRIDYAVAYSRELAIMGIDISKDRLLRSSLMGTTLIRPDAMKSEQKYGSRATELVERVAAHPSKASNGYYLKQARQYLDDLGKSLDELTRVSASGAVLILVVQDSYYKDVPVPLAEICIEEATARGWRSDASPQHYEVKRTLTQLNTAARAYVKGQVAETVVTLRRE